MVDQVLARVERLGHRALHDVLESDVAMEIDQRRHNGLAGQVDVCGSRGNAQLASAADLRKDVSGDDEGGVLDGRAAVSGDQPRAFKDSRAWPRGLSVHSRCASAQ